jgi:hypothetical protein
LKILYLPSSSWPGESNICYNHYLFRENEYDLS